MSKATTLGVDQELEAVSGSAQFRRGRGFALHTQITFPSAVRRTAAIAADRHEDADQAINKPAWNAERRVVAAWAWARVRIIVLVVRPDTAGCGGHAH